MPTVERSGNLRRLSRSARPLAAVAVLALLLGIVALPALAADPSASPGASAEMEPSVAPAASAEAEESAEPDESAKQTEEADETADPGRAAEPEAPGKPDKGPKDKDKPPKQEITLSGTVTTGTDSDGDTVYRMQSGGTTYVLEAGPKWFFGDDYPLKVYVGKNVTIRNRSGVTDYDGPSYFVREGIVIVPKGASIPDGTEI